MELGPLTPRGVLKAACALAVLAAAPVTNAQAADDVVIGAIYPLTGAASQAGTDAKHALEVMADIINGQHELPILLGHGGGLPHLGGAHVRLIFADHQSDPQKARTEAERLITQEHVAAILGTFQSATAATVGQVTERYEIPFFVADGSSPTLTQRGLRWTFRASPQDEMTTAAMFSFFHDMGAATGHPVHSVALIYEDTLFGADSGRIEHKDAEAAGIKVAADIRYRASSPSMASEAQLLRAADADVVMATSYTNDAILMVNAMHDLGYAPHAIMAQATGFADQTFLTAAGPLAEGVFSRSAFALDSTAARPAVVPVNALFRAAAGKDLNDTTAREMVALQVLADAIDRAGSTKPEAIRVALVATNIPGAQTIMPWESISFDQTGQNQHAGPVIQQVQGGVYRTVWPTAVASAKPVWKVGN